MHKIYIKKGSYRFIYGVVQIIYSSLISSVITTLLKRLSLSETSIIKMKELKKYKEAVKYSHSLMKCFKIKYFFYYIISFIFLFCFWYFIASFCAVYSNTQLILIKTTFSSYGLSLCYPFLLNLIPGILRIPALKAKRQDKKGLYTFSKIIGLI